LAVLVSVAVLSGQRCAKQNQVRSFAQIGNKGVSSLRVQVLGHFEGQGQIAWMASTKWCILRLRPRSDEPCNDQGFYQLPKREGDVLMFRAVRSSIRRRKDH